MISLQNLDREHAFSEADVRLLTTLAGSLSVALENARLFEETRQRNAELALINDVQRGLAENLEMQAMYDLVGDRLQEIFDAQVVDIGVLDRETGLLHFPYSIERGVRYPDEADASPAVWADTSCRPGEPLLINERATERALSCRRCAADGIGRAGDVRAVRPAGRRRERRPAGSRCRTSIASTRSTRRTSDC